MFDGKIDFMDFNKIKINYGGKLTCRKIFKRRYIIFLVLSLFCLIFLVSLYAIKNRKITGYSIEILEIERKIIEKDENITLMRKRNSEQELTISKIETDIRVIENENNHKNKTLEKAKKMNGEMIEEKENLEKQSTTLSAQLKKEKELKEVYEQKISSLKALLSSLKIEYEKLLEQKGENTIEKSRIINQIEAYGIEKAIKGKIGLKCFDGGTNNFNPIIFHQNCDGNAVLVLLKTDNKERIGAYTQVSFEGLEIKRDPSTALFNIDKGTTYELASSEYSTIVCDPNELPQFGVDLQIKSNGQGINSFPFNYGNKNKNSAEELTKNHVFQIENLEIYKVNLD